MKLMGRWGASFDAGRPPVKTGLYKGTRCQTKRESACLTCGFLDNIHLLLAWYRAISACQLNHVLLRSFRHFLITVSETDSNEISSNFNFPLPFQINLKLLPRAPFPPSDVSKELFIPAGRYMSHGRSFPHLHTKHSLLVAPPKSIRQRHLS